MRSINFLLREILELIRVDSLDQAWNYLEKTRFIFEGEMVDANVDKFVQKINFFLCGDKSIKKEELLKDYDNLCSPQTITE